MKRRWHNRRRRTGFCFSSEETRALRETFFREKLALAV
jgi:hypothetical protein